MAQDMSPREGAKSALHGRSLRGIAVLGGAVLLGSTFLSAPVTAQTVEELKAQIAELGQRVDELQNQNVATPMIAPAQAVTAGAFPGSIKLPGTNTSFKVSGYVKADIHYSTNAGLGDTFFANAIPVAGSAAALSDGATRIFARQTRFWIETRTPAAAPRRCRTRAASVCVTPSARSATSWPVRPGATS
jgi:outer membrane murein-binding lipoprotein Lpp